MEDLCFCTAVCRVFLSVDGLMNVSLLETHRVWLSVVVNMVI